jgi:hypothetical protein
MEGLSLDDPTFLPVSRAGEDGNHAWLDIGREFTEQWHDQMQIRDAVGAPPGTTVTIDVTGPSGGAWRLTRDERRWRIESGAADHPTTRIRLADDALWRLLFNAWPNSDIGSMHVTGDDRFAAPLLRARSVIV